MQVTSPSGEQRRSQRGLDLQVDRPDEERQPRRLVRQCTCPFELADALEHVRRSAQRQDVLLAALDRRAVGEHHCRGRRAFEILGAPVPVEVERIHQSQPFIGTIRLIDERGDRGAEVVELEREAGQPIELSRALLQRGGCGFGEG